MQISLYITFRDLKKKKTYQWWTEIVNQACFPENLHTSLNICIIIVIGLIAGMSVELQAYHVLKVD